VVECKRLGEAVSAKWILNANYVNHGVARFRDPEWAYAKRFPSGAMVGYWQSMKARDVLGEINNVCRQKSLPDLALHGKCKIGAVSQLEHIFERPFEISPFSLYHFWIDLRSGDKDYRVSQE
jgi:hypothetical protein